MTVGSISTDERERGGEARTARCAELAGSNTRVDEQAGDDRRDRAHRVDDRAAPGGRGVRRSRSGTARSRMPSGTEMNTARPTCSSVPTIACAPPPSVAALSGPTNSWVSVKKLRSKRTGSPCRSCSRRSRRAARSGRCRPSSPTTPPGDLVAATAPTCLPRDEPVDRRGTARTSTARSRARPTAASAVRTRARRGRTPTPRTRQPCRRRSG